MPSVHYLASDIHEGRDQAEKFINYVLEDIVPDETDKVVNLLGDYTRPGERDVNFLDFMFNPKGFSEFFNNALKDQTKEISDIISPLNSYSEISVNVLYGNYEPKEVSDIFGDNYLHAQEREGIYGFGGVTPFIGPINMMLAAILGLVAKPSENEIGSMNNYEGDPLAIITHEPGDFGKFSSVQKQDEEGNLFMDDVGNKDIGNLVRRIMPAYAASGHLESPKIQILKKGDNASFMINPGPLSDGTKEDPKTGNINEGKGKGYFAKILLYDETKKVLEVEFLTVPVKEGFIESVAKIDFRNLDISELHEGMNNVPEKYWIDKNNLPRYEPKYEIPEKIILPEILKELAEQGKLEETISEEIKNLSDKEINPEIFNKIFIDPNKPEGFDSKKEFIDYLEDFKNKYLLEESDKTIISELKKNRPITPGKIPGI